MNALENRIKEFLDNNYDGRLMLEIERFNNNPLALFEYCLDENDFGAICTLYYESGEDFCKEILPCDS